jgi:ABC-type amino acid transport substrate-binding protein
MTRTYRITKQLPPLTSPGARTSHINRAFNAALGQLLARGDGNWYARLYEKYINIAPRFWPTPDDCDRWSDVDPNDAALERMLARGELRFGYCTGEPYVYLVDGSRTGFDHELGTAVAQVMSEHFFGDPDRLRAAWKEVQLASDEQADKLAALHAGLVDDVFDVALSGQMMLPAQYLGGLALEWTAPTAMLFTAINYTGRHRDVLALAQLERLCSSDLDEFLSYAIAESRRLNL